MPLNKKTFTLAVCLFLITFKVVASSIFIQTGIERTCLRTDACSMSFADSLSVINEEASEEEPVHTLFLMSHVTGNVGDVEFKLPVLGKISRKFYLSNDKLSLDNILDCPFKPPKA